MGHVLLILGRGWGLSGKSSQGACGETQVRGAGVGRAMLTSHSLMV